MRLIAFPNGALDPLAAVVLAIDHGGAAGAAGRDHVAAADDAVVVPIAITAVTHDHALPRALVAVGIGTEAEFDALGGGAGGAHHGESQSKRQLFHRRSPVSVILGPITNSAARCFHLAAKFFCPSL